MALLWFLLGAFVVVSIIGVRKWINGNNLSVSILSWFGMIVGGAFFFFAVAWCVTSFIEGETQAGIMGILFFGVPAIIILVITGRAMVRGAAS